MLLPFVPYRASYSSQPYNAFLAISLLIAILGMVGTAYLGYNAVNDLVSNQQSEARARTTALELQNLFNLALNAETGQRGFVITGEERYLQPYQNALRQTPDVLRELRKGMADDLRQLQRLDSFEHMQQLKFAELAESIAARRAGGFPAAQEIVKTDRGRDYMLQMRADVNDMTRTENGKLAARIAYSNAAAVRASHTILFAGAINLALLLAVLLAVRSGNRARQAAALKLDEARRFLRSVVDGSPALIYVKDHEGRFILVNAAFERFTGLTADTALGKSAEELFPEQVARRHAESDRYVLDHGEPVQYEESMMQTATRQLRHFVSAKVPLRDTEGQLLGVCAVFSDVTPLKAAESEVRQLNQTLEKRVIQRTDELAQVNGALREANAHLEAFSYTVAHDLRAPLRGIQGFAQAVYEDYEEHLDPTGRDYLSRISRAATRMEGLIDDLLAFARLARAELPATRVALHDAVSDAMRNLVEPIAATHAHLDVAPDLHTVQANPAACVQIVQNLLSNALKFTRKGEIPAVRIWSERIDHRVRLMVEDNGIGILPEQHDRIFQPFERLHGQEEYLGTGIGLAIVDKAARRMGGSCGVESAAGQGSRFWVELPLSEGEAE